MNKKLLKRIEEIFYARLEEKNGWGKNEIKSLYTQCVNEAVLEMID